MTEICSQTAKASASIRFYVAKMVGKNGVGERDFAEPELDGRYVPPG